MDADILGTRERRVMEQLWRVSSATVAEVRDALNAVGPRALAYTTVMTILIRLHEKGYVTRQAGREGHEAALMDGLPTVVVAGLRRPRTYCPSDLPATLDASELRAV